MVAAWHFSPVEGSALRSSGGGSSREIVWRYRGMAYLSATYQPKQTAIHVSSLLDHSLYIPLFSIYFTQCLECTSKIRLANPGRQA